MQISAPESRHGMWRAGMLSAARWARGTRAFLWMQGGKFVLYQRPGESGGTSCPVCPGAATALQRCPKALPSFRQPRLWVKGGCGEGLSHPSLALQDGDLSPLLSVSRAVFPFGCDGCSLMPRQWREDLALAGVQTMLISPWVSGSSRYFFRSPSKDPSATVQAPRASQSAQQGKSGQNMLSNHIGLQSHSFPSKEMLKIECRLFIGPCFELK